MTIWIVINCQFTINTMYKGQYDTDVTVWSPQGRLLQVEYAKEAVKQGSISLGLSNKRYVLLAALKVAIDVSIYHNHRSILPGPLAGFQKKMYAIDEHCGHEHFRSQFRCKGHMVSIDAQLMPIEVRFCVARQSKSATHMTGLFRWPNCAPFWQIV